MKHPRTNTMLPLLNTLLWLFAMMPILSLSLTMKLIPPSSPESPFYMPNLSFLEKIDRIAKLSQSRALYLANKHNHNHGVAPKRSMVHPPVSAEQGIYVIKLGLGTFPGKTPPYKSYYFQMDTGSHKIWLECDDCERIHKCMPQKGEPPFPCHLSRTCHPIKCIQHGFHTTCDGSLEFCDDKRNCLYDISYLDKSRTVGFVAYETFTFEGQKPNRHVVVKDIRFGCGYDQANLSLTYVSDNRVAGLVGLGWGPDSLHTQLDSVSDSTFSYCLPPLDDSIHHDTYLSFGADIGEITPEFQLTSMMLQVGGYLIFIQDISVNQKRLKVSLGCSYKFSDVGGKAVVVDSGTMITRMPKLMFDAVASAISKLLSHNPSVVAVGQLGGYDLCYKTHKPVRDVLAGLPNMTYHLESGAKYEMGPEIMFTVDKNANQFCLDMFSVDEDEEFILGANQQVNKKIVFDPKRSRLLFKPQVC